MFYLRLYEQDTFSLNERIDSHPVVTRIGAAHHTLQVRFFRRPRCLCPCPSQLERSSKSRRWLERLRWVGAIASKAESQAEQRSVCPKRESILSRRNARAREERGPILLSGRPFEVNVWTTLPLCGTVTNYRKPTTIRLAGVTDVFRRGFRFARSMLQAAIV
jgi:hypothetical protein